MLLQDWAYVVGKCFELTLEVNDAKHPPAELLPELFVDNLPALLAFASTAALGGLRQEKPAPSPTSLGV